MNNLSVVKYVKDIIKKKGLRTSTEFMEVLDKRILEIIETSCENLSDDNKRYKKYKRTTIMSRDISKVKISNE